MTHARTGNASSFSTAGFAHPPRNVAALGIEKGMNVADFGSGSGAYVLLMAEALGGTGHVYAVDIQKDLLRRVHNEAQRRGLKGVEIVWGDLEAPQGSRIAPESLDLVLISNLLFQVDEKEHVLREALRILRPSGRIAIIDWSESFDGMGPEVSAVCGREAALALARSVHLPFVEEFQAGAHHYGFIFRKSAEDTSDVDT